MLAEGVRQVFDDLRRPPKVMEVEHDLYWKSGPQAVEALALCSVEAIL